MARSGQASCHCIACINPTAHPAPSPPACAAVYLLDDGRDVEKKKFMHSLGVSNVVYVRWAGLPLPVGLAHACPACPSPSRPPLASLTAPAAAAPPLPHCSLCPCCSGRKRAKGEMNGKSCNINNAARQIYPDRGAQHPIPLEEVLCVFDADQVSGGGEGGLVGSWAVGVAGFCIRAAAASKLFFAPPATMLLTHPPIPCIPAHTQVPNADFFLKMVPLLDGGQDVGMVLSPQVSGGAGAVCTVLLLTSWRPPSQWQTGSSSNLPPPQHLHSPALPRWLQTFYNLNAGGDIFNHANVHFWDYSQPGYDALGLISCTGTNFLVRARAFQQVRRGVARWQAQWPGERGRHGRRWAACRLLLWGYPIKQGALLSARLPLPLPCPPIKTLAGWVVPRVDPDRGLCSGH